MKFYGAVMLTDIEPSKDTACEWIEISASQHATIMRILLNNVKMGAETRLK
jgi:hypothetical protein